VQALSAAAAPFLIRAMLDDALPHRNVSLLVGLGAATAGAAALAGWPGERTRQAHSTASGGAWPAHLDVRPPAAHAADVLHPLPDHRAADPPGHRRRRLVVVLTVAASSAVQNGMLLLAIGTALMFLDWRLGLIAVRVAAVLMAVTGRIARSAAS